jgi:hypothetical protein
VALLFGSTSAITIRQSEADMFNIMNDDQLNSAKDKSFKDALRNKNLLMYESIVHDSAKFENDHDAYLASLMES